MWAATPQRCCHGGSVGSGPQASLNLVLKLNRAALCAVLALEAEVEAFVMSSEEHQHIFSGDMSSYEVGSPQSRLVHRHYAHSLPL